MAGPPTPRRAERESRQDEEAEQTVKHVAVIETSVGGRYAYHKPSSLNHAELGVEVEIDCNTHGDNSSFILRRRSWATDRWLAPCQRCDW